jgi:hypothetical protein
MTSSLDMDLNATSASTAPGGLALHAGPEHNRALIGESVRSRAHFGGTSGGLSGCSGSGSMRLGTGSAMARVPLLPRGSLFRQYFFVLFAAVVVPLLAAGGNYTISS